MSTAAMRTRIKLMREGKGMTQKDMADRLHMDPRNYQRIENGESKLLDIDLLTRIAEVLETDVPELLTSEVVNIEQIGDNNDQSSVPVGNNEVTINNNAFPEDLRKAYEDMIQLTRDLIAEKNRTIDLLQQIVNNK